MTRRVLKFSFKGKTLALQELPGLGRVVLFARQRDVVCVWVETDTGGFNHRWLFEIFATGEEVADQTLEWLASCEDGPWVWHLYGKRV